MNETNEMLVCDECKEDLTDAGFKVELKGGLTYGYCDVCQKKLPVYPATWKKEVKNRGRKKAD
jgi:hypothetical protein